MAIVRARAFSGPTEHIVLTHPLFGTKSVLSYGVPIGIDMITRELVYFDPWYLKSIGAIHSAQGLFIADKGFGKSTTLKIIAVRLGMLAAGYNAMRISVNDHKNEAEHMEYSDLIETIGAKQFNMMDMQVNPFDPRLCPKLGNLIDMAAMLCSFSTTDVLDVTAKTALRVAVYKMYELDSKFWLPATLLQLLRTLRSEDVSDYLDKTGKILLSEEDQVDRPRTFSVGRSVADEVFDARGRLAGRDVTLSTDAIIRSAAHVYHLLDDLLSGEDAGLFGSGNSLYDMYTQRANGKSWAGLTKRGESVMRSLDAKIKSYAIENRDYQLIPHLELDDERHRSISDIVNARASAYFSKVARAVPTCNISATHRLDDLRRDGVGSEAYNLGESIINDMGFVWIGRQKNSEKTLKELQDRYRLTNIQRDQLATLDKYCFLVKLGEEWEPTFVRVFATPKELEIVKTDRANELILSRPNINSSGDLQHYGNVNGVKFLGIKEA